MSKQEKSLAHLKLCVFRREDAVRVVNLKTLDGMDNEHIFAYGFTEKGEPVSQKAWIKSCKYQLSGLRCGFLTMNHSFIVGVLIDPKKNIKVQGFNAISEHLGRNGLWLSPSEVAKKVSELLTQGVQIIYFALKSKTYGMSDRTYGLFQNEWIITGKEPPVDYEVFNDLVLKKTLKSHWRIWTPKTEKLLKRLILNELDVRREEE